ncbi:stemmadenine O-acetyltransferase-like [Impatiens glandulifera]|uniref:stemmadenine O-acetyltransferase-like n=1 Tax=Impatiens glandulifera TaxID=253017 RepID=UPI001FB15D8C|nr:stemmadenine O-acetyltransferase-like [Impatiens glandulifera]
MEVVVTSSEIVKPSNPTPPDLRRLPLSFLDQLTDPNFMTLIFYYVSTPDSFRLKTALSDALSRFYPLAGRVQANDSVQCNDLGIHYREAKVGDRHRLIDVIEKSQPSDIKSLIPPKPPSDDHIMTIQVNFFSCGGIAIANLCSHKVMDASSLISFVNAWAAIARNHDLNSIPSPKFDMTTFFPPREASIYSRRTADIENNVVSRRFIFSASALSLLRDKYNNNNNNNNVQRGPSLVEALSTFIWTRFVHVHVNNNKYALIQAVNLRTRIKPNLPESYFGNLSWIALASAEGDTSGYEMVRRMRESIKKIDVEYIEKLKNGDLQMEELEKQELTVMSFSAMHKFPMKEVDFGVGEPVWVSLGGLNMRNTVHFLPMKKKMSIEEEEDGVEVWINLKEEEMHGLEKDTEFLCFASPVSGLA